MRKDIIPYYRALGLSPGAEPVEIRRAYRQMIQQWHPDLYKPGSPMQTTAEDITKEINEAYDQLYRKKLYRNFSAKRERKPESAVTRDPEGPPGADESEAEPKRPRAGKAGTTKPAKARQWTGWFAKGGGRWAAAGAAIALGGILVPLGRLRADPAAFLWLFSPHQEPAPAKAVAAVAVTLRKTDDKGPRYAPPGKLVGVAQRPTGGTATSSEILLPGRMTPAHPDAALLMARAEELLSVIERGDTKARVLAIQGTPDETSENIFRYGSSVVYFEEGRVKSWLDRKPRLHVRDWSVEALPTLDTFWMGSSRGDVMRAQGMPAAFDATSYTYGSSVVFFDRGLVAGWSEGDTRLRQFEMPSLPFIDLDRLQLLESRAPLEF